MNRLPFIVLIIASASTLGAQEGQICKCCEKDETLSFREQVLSDLHPLTREVMDTLIQADEWEKCRQPDRQPTPGLGLRITVPPMGPTPINLKIEMPELEVPAPDNNKPLPDHLATY